MTVQSRIARIFQQEELNFLITNRIPRRLATQFMGWFSQIEWPPVRDASITVWRFFSGLDLSEAEATHYRSMHDCFIRRLKPGARPIDGDARVMVSPCDAIVGACGKLAGTELFQIKGFPYRLEDLLPDPALVETHRNGCYVTLRLTAAMYHRFHAPHDCHVEEVTYISGDTFNVNPIALRRIENLFCRNERAVIRTRLAAGGQSVTLVPVAAILVASIRLHFLDVLLNLRYRGRNKLPCDVHMRKGEEMGWFQHGSTIIVFAPDGFKLCEGIAEGATIRMGKRLMYVA